MFHSYFYSLIRYKNDASNFSKNKNNYINTNIAKANIKLYKFIFYKHYGGGCRVP